MKIKTQIDAAQSASSIWVLCPKQNFHCYMVLLKQASSRGLFLRRRRRNKPLDRTGKRCIKRKAIERGLFFWVNVLRCDVKIADQIIDRYEYCA